MKRPVTSLCRRPGKKDRLRGSLSPMREQFPPTGTLRGGQAELPGKSRPNEGSKTVPGGGQGCAQAAPMGEWRTSCAGWCLEGAALGARRGRGHAWAQKTAPSGGRELCADCAHGGMADIMCGVVSGRCRTEHTPGQRVRPGAKQPPARAGDCAQAAPMWEWRAMGCLVPGRHRTGRTPGQRARPGAKTAPGGGRRLSGCGIWVLLAPGDPCDLDAQGGQHSQAEDHAQLSQGEICHQEQAMQSGDQQHSQEQQHAHTEGSQ